MNLQVLLWLSSVFVQSNQEEGNFASRTHLLEERQHSRILQKLHNFKEKLCYFKDLDICMGFKDEMLKHIQIEKGLNVYN